MYNGFSSKTCPQCRAKVSSKSLLRLYVNVANSQGPEADVTLLQHKLDSTEFNMKLKDQEIKNIAEKNRDIHKQNKALRYGFTSNLHCFSFLVMY